jgi:hypothetical protein
VGSVAIKISLIIILISLFLCYVYACMCLIIYFLDRNMDEIKKNDRKDS